MIETALSMIQPAKLRFPDQQLVGSFLQESGHWNRAATYFLDRCNEPDSPTCGLDHLLADWKQLVTLCKHSCVSVEMLSLTDGN